MFSTPSRQISLLAFVTMVIIIFVVGALVTANQLQQRFARMSAGASHAGDQREAALLAQDEANLRLMAGAVEAYRRAHAGRLPKAPGSLVPHYLRALPLDPANGLPYAIVVITGSRSPYEIDDASGFSRDVVRQTYGLPSAGLRYDYNSGLSAKDYDY